MTPFSDIYDRFYGKITDDMYVVWTKEDTEADQLNILLDAIPTFEFPRFKLYDYNIEEAQYNCDLTLEEQDILAISMVITWLKRQISSVEYTRQKYSGTDFKMSSQANHLDKLSNWVEENKLDLKHAQRLYKRRKINKDGTISSNWSCLREETVL